ncbi:MAG: hexose transporter hxt1 [Cirrosporium novae-zelandiae]|nr:MAG: hexose transporter hxt1 [Cirrosporium novae-zelandiae]
MGILSRFIPSPPHPVTEEFEKHSEDIEKAYNEQDRAPVPLITWRTLVMALLVSMGGIVFGYDTGQISGFLEMTDFQRRFGQYDSSDGFYSFSDVRSGLIVGLLSIGTLIGALIAAPIADRWGRKPSISLWCAVFIIGVVIQISSATTWYQVVIGRIIAGFGIGGLSVVVVMFQGETSPSHLRGSLVATYQLFITIGILVSNIINYGTEYLHNSGQWRITMAVGFIFPLVLGLGIQLYSETPRFDYRHGNEKRAKETMAKVHGIPDTHVVIAREIREMEEKLEAERQGGNAAWYEIFTGPRMLYRTLLGVAIQALQQLTGANFFFYYGTTIFQATGLSNSFITQIILGAVNVACTFPGLWFVERFGRRKSLIVGGLWMFVCFMIFASLGHFKLRQPDGTNSSSVGSAMIVFACLFIAAFASTWGPFAWVVISEMYPSRYRARCMALSTASNWIFNFLIAFFTPFITSAIDYRYGYIFASCCFAGAVLVYFCLIESKGRTLEEIDTMYILYVKPWESENWVAPEGEDLVDADKLDLARGGRSWNKRTQAGQGNTEQLETTTTVSPDHPALVTGAGHYGSAEIAE